jgi:hypothetical protein
MRRRRAAARPPVQRTQRAEVPACAGTIVHVATLRPAKRTGDGHRPRALAWVRFDRTEAMTADGVDLRVV